MNKPLLLIGLILFGAGVAVPGALGLLLSMLGGGIEGLALFA
jgi:hypothetical protein